MEGNGSVCSNPFDSGSDAYTRYRPTYPATLVQGLASMCDKRDLVLDVGCGSGQLSRLLTTHFRTVVATDLSEEQIARAPSHPCIDYRHEPAENISLEAGAANLIVAAQAAHWFDLPTFYDEARRVAATNGVVALISYGVLRLDDELETYFQQFYWREIHRFWPAERKHVENGYAEFDFPFVEIDLPPFAIECDWSLVDFLGYVRTWSAVKVALDQGGSVLVDGFEHGLTALWGDPTMQRRISWPIVGRVGRP